MKIAFAFLMIFLLTCFSITGQKKQINYLEYGPEVTHLYSGPVGMYQDDDGYIWAYGLDGISRFDGIHFERIQSVYPESAKLPIKNCLSFFKDDNYLWIGTTGAGLFYIDHNGKLGDFQKKCLPNAMLQSKIIKQVISLQDHLFVVGEAGLETFQSDGNSFKKNNTQEKIKLIFAHDNTLWMSDRENIYARDLTSGVTNNYTDYHRASFFKDHQDKLWISTFDKLNIIHRYNKTNGNIEKLNFQPFDNATRKLNFCFSDNLELWAIESGKATFSIASFKDEKLTAFENISIDLKEVLFLRTPFRDRNNRLWLFSQNLRLINNEVSFSSLRLNSLNGIPYFDLLVNGNLVFAGLQNSGMIKYNVLTGEEQLFTTENSLLAHNYVSRIEPLQDNKIGVCQMNHFQVYDLQNGFSPAIKLKGITRSLFENETHYWVGGLRSVFKIAKKDNAFKNIKVPSIFTKFNNAVNEIFDYDIDHLLLATSMNGLVKLNKHTDEITGLEFGTNVHIDSLQINKTVAAAISPDKKNIALATDSGLKIVELGKSIKSIPTKDYFFKNVIFQSDTILYATSNNEVIRYDLLHSRVERFNHFNGLMNSTYSMRSSDIDEFGNVYFSGNNGIDLIKNTRIVKQKSAVNLQIEKISFGEHTLFYPIEKALVFSPEDRHVEIKINTPGNIEGKNIKIQENYSFENRWTDLHESGILSLINPTSGNTEISFRAVDLTGDIRSEIININLEFKQYWYQNIWVWLITALFILGGLFTAAFIYQDKKNKSIQSEMKLKEELASLKLQSLNAQMNPHFIFNALSSIQQLISEGKPTIAQDYLVKFSRLLRYVIQYADDQSVQLSEEVNFIKNYIDLEQLRFSDSFQYVINNSIDNVAEIEIPPFFIQPQVENAIKHGLRNKDGMGLITINIQKIEQRLQVEIKDNGIGREAAQKLNTYLLDNTKKGILLTKERIDHLNRNNKKASIQIIDLKDEVHQSIGTSVILEFDIAKQNSIDQK